MKASTYVLCFTSPVNIALNVLLVHKTSLGFLGAPLAISVTYWLSFLILAIFTTFSPTHRKNKTWTGIQIAKLFDVASVVEMLKLAIPGIIMVGTEWYGHHLLSMTGVTSWVV
jgi:MATE family multidrug resistance protein